jgi:hypothetical protein
LPRSQRHTGNRPEIQRERLERLLTKVVPLVDDPDIETRIKAIEQARKLIADLRQLLGVNVPVPKYLEIGIVDAAPLPQHIVAQMARDRLTIAAQEVKLKALEARTIEGEVIAQ